MSVDDAAIQKGLLVAGLVVAMLAEGELVGVHNLGAGQGVSIRELQRGVDSLGAPLVDSPRVEWAQVEFVPLEYPADNYSAVVGLWTANGRTGTGVSLRLFPNEATRSTMAELGLVSFYCQIVGFVPVEPLDPDFVVPDPPPRRPEPELRNPRERPETTNIDAIPERWRAAIGDLAHRLVIGDYDGLAADGLVANSDHPEFAGVGYAIEKYPSRLVELGPYSWDLSEHAPYDDDKVFQARIDLSTEDGSDGLTMNVFVADDGKDVVAMIESVHG